jgi:2,4-dienoyl-CoA reductase-like NADH-dependent reductase (Old Yellow Enzyme family)/NADPH-dependent 2,4-dienoyl-CoA reductase/sulfur reductase-like enzyme
MTSARTGTRFAHLLSPGRIGSLTLPNRVVMPAMDMNLCVDGELTDAEIDHYAARARGGVGLVITGTGAVSWPDGAASLHQPGFSDDRYIHGMARLADAVHAEGGRVAMQLCHHGKVATVDMAAGRPVLVPSVPVPAMDLAGLVDCTPDELMGLATASGGRLPGYREANDADLAAVVDAFAAAARRVQSAGIDAIEIHAAHGYLLSTFLSPGYNRRTDGWGGDDAGRARLTCEVVSAVRAVVGPDYPLLVRINGIEFGPDGGLDPAGAARVAPLIVAAGADAIHVSANAHDPFARFTDGPLPSVVGAYRHAAAAVTAAVDVPVVAVGRLLPEVADAMLAAEECDFVSMGRQLLADPDLVRHLTDGGSAGVRPCINCYVCVAQNFVDATPRCAVNARLGRGECAPLPPVDSPRRVLVVGGGPAGLEAARVAASRGHDVELWEATNRLGGTVRVSALTAPDNEPVADWLANAAVDAGARIRLRTPATVDAVSAAAPDVVVVATGARHARPAFADVAVPAHAPRVHTGDQFRALLGGASRRGGVPPSLPWHRALPLTVARRLGLLRSASLMRRLSHLWLPMGRRVVVAGGGLVGLEVATFLAERGRDVTLVSPSPQLGIPLALPRRWTAVRHAEAAGVDLRRSAEVVALEPGGVRIRGCGDGRSGHDGSEVVVPATDLVVADGISTDTELASSLEAAGFEVHVAGDAGDVGYIEGAVRSGHDIGCVL